MKTVVSPLFAGTNSHPRPGASPRVRLVAAVVAMAAMLPACTDTPNLPPAAAISTVAPTQQPLAATSDADFGRSQPSPEARQMANGILRSRDHAGADFIIVDKKNAMLYVFGANGTLRGASAVLLGAARGDDSVPGIGLRPINQIRPEERTTPAGRFVAERGRNTQGEDIVWVDYDAAVSMHRVRTNNAKERRLERLATPTPDDNRISYGCINIPVAFYETVVAPIFANERAIVYVLPEEKSLQQVFSFHAYLRGS